jgi:hypothetical protein
MENLNFWSTNNFGTWQDFRDFWREFMHKEGRPIPDDTDTFWEGEWQDIRNAEKESK